jgi:FkbM family methyltransferase
MIQTLQSLTGDFVLLDLGSAHSGNLLRRTPELARAVTLIEIDPQATGNSIIDRHHRIRLPKAVAGTPGPRLFKHRAFPEGSSFLDPHPGLVRDYGLEQYYRLVHEETIECANVQDLLDAQNIHHVDLIKTDLEGMDLEVLRSAPKLLRTALVLQCELRFQPFYRGEPDLFEAMAFLQPLGFDLVSLRPHVWKYATPNRHRVRDGRLTWADTILFLKPDRVRELGLGWQACAKQILLAGLLGLANFAEHLFELYAEQLPSPMREELSTWVRPGWSLGGRLAHGIARLPGGWLILGAIRRLSLQCARRAGLFKDPVLGMLDPP